MDSKRWMREHVTDPFVRRAKAEGYRSRAAYKLMEIDKQDKLIQPGSLVVDLGAAPGGWSQVAAERAGKQGRVLAIDLLEFPAIAQVQVLRGDFTTAALQQALVEAMNGRADLVMSDMAPNISGVRLYDQARACELAQAALVPR